VWLTDICHSAASILPDWQLPGKMAEFLRSKFGNIRQNPAETRQTCRKGSEYNIAAYLSHILNNGIILNMCTPHMPLFQIGVTFFEYAAWLYSGMSAVKSLADISAQIPYLSEFFLPVERHNL
jgi:hypothetical protein